MTEAEKAFAAAEAEIARVAAADGTTLELSGEAFNALEELPETIAGLVNLQSLILSNTQISDLAHIAGLVNLKGLSLDNTQISDLAHIAGLGNLLYLRLDNTQISDLAHIARLVNLQTLYLDNTQISDLAHIAGLVNLKGLSLTNTQISDLAHIAGLVNLQTLWLNNTQISDLAHIRGLPNLRAVFFNGAPVADLRPLLSCPALATAGHREIRFAETEAARRDPELARLAEIEKYVERTDQTLAYLRTLPEWPAPLGLEATGDGSDPDAQEPAKPSPRPAPLRVAFVDGELREVGSDTGLAEEAAEREALGRAALADYLASFDEAQLARIENVLPRLGRAMGQLSAALAASDAFNPIAAGMQGERVIRLSRDAPDRLMDDDGDDVAHFSMQVALYLDRFLVWQAYKEDATLEQVPVQEIAEALPEFEAVKGTLLQAEWTTDDVKQRYEILFAEFRENTNDPLAAKGLQDATREVFYEIGQEAAAEAKPLKESGEFSKFKATYKTELTTGIAKDAARVTRVGTYTAGTTVLTWVLVNSPFLLPLASRFPYLKEVLRYLGVI